jgi:hypothetical protein
MNSKDHNSTCRYNKRALSIDMVSDIPAMAKQAGQRYQLSGLEFGGLECRLTTLRKISEIEALDSIIQSR